MGRTVTVGDLALTRSGDKGADANVGVWTHTEAAYRLLDEQLTAEVVARHFASVCHGTVRRYHLANLLAFNFVLGDALDGGGPSSMRTDAQGKVFGLAMAMVPIVVPDGFAVAADGRSQPDRAAPRRPEETS
jgi:hypothetical protein